MTHLHPPLPEPIYVELDGAQIATYELGAAAPAAPAVVLCHGTPWSAAVWADVAHSLSRDHRVLLWDMPGYGRSTQSPEIPVDLAAQMARFAALLEHWELARPNVVAHDIGGAVALGAHLLHGRDLTALYLWDVVTLDPWGSPFFRLVAEHADVFAALPARLHAALVREYIVGAAHRDLSEESLEILCRPWLTDDGQPAFYRQIAALSSRDTQPLQALLGQVRCPTRIGWGAQDPWIPVEQAHRLSELLPGKPQPSIVPTAGHLVPLEQPQWVIDTLQDWLASSGG